MPGCTNIPTFGIRIKESLEELDFNPDIIAKFEFPETPPWTYPTAMVDLTLSYAKKDVHYARAAQAFGAGIKCWHCTWQKRGDRHNS